METTIIDLLKKNKNCTLEIFDGKASIQNETSVWFTNLTRDEYREAKEDEEIFIIKKLETRKSKAKSSKKLRTAFRLSMQA